jgi:hypothetical protein
MAGLFIVGSAREDILLSRLFDILCFIMLQGHLAHGGELGPDVVHFLSRQCVVIANLLDLVILQHTSFNGFCLPSTTGFWFRSRRGL